MDLAFLTFEIVVGIIVLLLINQYIYDRWVQRKSSLLVSYPVIGRMRYLFEMLREPMRQYFGKEEFYESYDKVSWVYKAAKNVPLFMSFSISQPFSGARFVLKHSNHVLNDEEVSKDFSVTFGANRKEPFISKSVIARSAMSDGALSPEATRAFALGAKKAMFPINTGEGGLTSNFFFEYCLDCSGDEACFEKVQGNPNQIRIYNIMAKLFNGSVATKVFRSLVLKGKNKETYILDRKRMCFFRPDWGKPLEAFPQEVPPDMPDIIFQMGSGLYGVRDTEGNFDPECYQKVMRFCRMTEIKIAQGAKQTGGKLIGSKVTEDIAYYRRVEAYKDLMSPNRFPYAKSDEELAEFVGTLQELSGKPVGIKIVISGIKETEKMVQCFKECKEKGLSYPDFITVDSGSGGSGTAPLEMMESVGLNTINALYVIDLLLRKHGLREDIKVIISGKILTPDDVAINLALGADMVGIARAFMMSGGCIRARHCSGQGGHVCPVGMATRDKRRRQAYLVFIKSEHIANYHNNLIKGLRGLLAIMGLDHVSKLSKKDLTFKNKSGEIFFDVDKYFMHKLHD